MKRRGALIVLGAGLAAPLVALAQPKVRRIAVLTVRSRPTPSNPEANFVAFAKAMSDLGYVEGKTLHVEWRFAEGKFERLPALAAELVRLNPEVIVTHSTPATEALQRATRSIPIVVAVVNDPVGSGFAKSLAHPGGNITGLSLISVDVSQKQVELLKALVPKLQRVAVLHNPDTTSHAPILKSLESAAQKLGLRILIERARNPDEIQRRFETMAKEGARAVVVLPDALYTDRRRVIAELAVKGKLPVIYPNSEHVAAGGLMSYGTNNADFWRLAATYVDKILKGAKPGELPIEQPTRLHLAINLRAAKALGLTISKELQFRADEVIE